MLDNNPELVGIRCVSFTLMRSFFRTSREERSDKQTWNKEALQHDAAKVSTPVIICNPRSVKSRLQSIPQATPPFGKQRRRWLSLKAAEAGAEYQWGAIL